jgi:hypothetical protein
MNFFYKVLQKDNTVKKELGESHPLNCQQKILLVYFCNNKIYDKSQMFCSIFSTFFLQFSSKGAVSNCLKSQENYFL